QRCAAVRRTVAPAEQREGPASSSFLGLGLLRLLSLKNRIEQCIVMPFGKRRDRCRLGYRKNVEHSPSIGLSLPIANTARNQDARAAKFGADLGNEITQFVVEFFAVEPCLIDGIEKEPGLF